MAAILTCRQCVADSSSHVLLDPRDARIPQKRDCFPQMQTMKIMQNETSSLAIKQDDANQSRK